MNTKYKRGKFEEDLKPGEDYYDIRYQYNGLKFVIRMSAGSGAKARERFNAETHGDWCAIDYITKIVDDEQD